LLASGSSAGKQSVTDQARPRDAVNPHRAGHIVLGAGVHGFSMVKSHHAAIRSLSHSSMKAESSFQLQVLGVTALIEPGSGRAPSVAVRAPQPWQLVSCNRSLG
jgi:hypothetical protein